MKSFSVDWLLTYVDMLHYDMSDTSCATPGLGFPAVKIV